MSKYKISKTHRDILERAVEPYSDFVELKFIGVDFVSLRCKSTDKVFATAYIHKGSCETSTEGLASMIGEIMFWASRYMQVLEEDSETKQ